MKVLLKPAASAFVFSIAMAGVAHSQENAGASEDENADRRLSTVTVTAQKREENIRNVPIAISAFSADDIELRGIDSIDDLTVSVPGLSIGEIAGTGQINLRGVGFGLVTGAGENSVAVHYDGLYIANPGASLMLQQDIGSIEVLKGPQGTLYGRNATGGVINFNSAAPADEFEASGRMGYGNLDAKTAAGVISGPLSNSVRARASIDYIDRNGYIDNLSLGGEEGGLERLGGRLSLDADLSSRLSASLRLFSATEDSGQPIYDPIDNTFLDAFTPADTVELDPYKIRTNRRADSTKEVTGGSARLDYRLTEDITLSSITGLVDYTFETMYDGDGTSTPIFDDVIRSIDDKTFSQDLILIGDGEALDWTLGAYYLDQSITVDSLTTTAGLAPFGLSQIDNFSDEEIESYAVFADATLDLNETFSVFGGLRYLEETRDFQQEQVQYLDSGLLAFQAWAGALAVDPMTDPTLFGLDATAAFDALADPTTIGNLFTNVAVPINVCDTVTAQPGNLLARSGKDDHVTGRVGLKGEFGTTNIYGQYSTGYKSGGFGTSTCDDMFEPETLNSFEIGMKSLLGNATSLNAAVYFYDYTNLQVEELVSPQIFVNNADAEILGLEADLVSRLTDSVTLNLGISLADATFTEFENIDPFNPGLGVQNLDGNPIPRSPDYQVSAGLQYYSQLASGKSLTLRGDILASGAFQLREFDNSADEQSSYVTGNISANLAFNETLAVRGWVKNIADEAVLGGVINAQSLAPVRVGSYGLPRTYGIEIIAKF